MDQQERMNYWWKRAKAAEAVIDQVQKIADHPHHAFEVATDTFNESGAVVWVKDLEAVLEKWHEARP